MAAVLQHADEILRVLVRDNLCVARWTDTPTARHFDVIVAVMRMTNAGGEKGVLLNVVDAPGKVPRFTDDLRRSGAAMGKALGPLSRATAHVVLLDGFVGTSVRMFLSTISLLSRSSSEVATFGRVDEGARWLATQTQGKRRWAADEILGAYRLVG